MKTIVFPIKPQRIFSDLREALEPKGIVFSNVGAHKFWITGLYLGEAPNTCIILNRFVAMGIALPGAIADNAIVVIDVPVDYSSDIKPTKKLGNLDCPL